MSLCEMTMAIERIAQLESDLVRARQHAAYEADVSKQAVAALAAERERSAALAATIAECPFPSELTNPDTATNSLPIYVQWRAERFFRWCDARKGDIEAAKAILAAHDAEVERKAMERCEAIALGCKDYGGGYRGTPEEEAYRDGMQTVATVIRAIIDKPDDVQARAVELVGAEERTAALKAEGGRG